MTVNDPSPQTSGKYQSHVIERELSFATVADGPSRRRRSETIQAGLLGEKLSLAMVSLSPALEVLDCPLMFLR
jgi:hypothetical protein